MPGTVGASPGGGVGAPGRWRGSRDALHPVEEGEGACWARPRPSHCNREQRSPRGTGRVHGGRWRGPGVLPSCARRPRCRHSPGLMFGESTRLPPRGTAQTMHVGRASAQDPLACMAGRGSAGTRGGEASSRVAEGKPP